MFSTTFSMHYGFLRRDCGNVKVLQNSAGGKLSVCYRDIVSFNKHVLESQMDWILLYCVSSEK